MIYDSHTVATEAVFWYDFEFWSLKVYQKIFLCIVGSNICGMNDFSLQPSHLTKQINKKKICRIFLHFWQLFNKFLKFFRIFKRKYSSFIAGGKLEPVILYLWICTFKSEQVESFIDACVAWLLVVSILFLTVSFGTSSHWKFCLLSSQTQLWGLYSLSSWEYSFPNSWLKEIGSFGQNMLQ